MSTRRRKKARPPKRRRVTNPRGGKPTDDEVRDMHALGYRTIAEAAKDMNRAGSSIYDRIRRFHAGAAHLLPKVNPEREPVVKTASGNVWVYLDSLRKGADPVALATGKAS